MKQNDKKEHHSNWLYKIFIGGIPLKTSERQLYDHFSKYGEILDLVIIKDKESSKARGFGFVTFKHEMPFHIVLRERHEINGKTLDLKQALPRELNQKVERKPQENKKIFIGGLPKDLSMDEFKGYFEKYGEIVDIAIICDKKTKEPRGFGFVSYKNIDSANYVLSDYSKHYFGDKWVECKMSYPKELRNGNHSYSFGQDQQVTQNFSQEPQFHQTANSHGSSGHQRSKTFNGYSYDYRYQYEQEEEGEAEQEQEQSHEEHGYNNFHQQDHQPNMSYYHQHDYRMHQQSPPQRNELPQYHYTVPQKHQYHQRQGSGPVYPADHEKRVAGTPYGYLQSMASPQQYPYTKSSPQPMNVPHSMRETPVSAYQVQSPTQNPGELYRNNPNELSPTPPANAKLKSQGSSHGEVHLMGNIEEQQSINLRRQFAMTRTYSNYLNDYGSNPPTSQPQSSSLINTGQKKLNRLATADLANHGEEQKPPARNFMYQRSMFQSIKSHSLHPEDLAGYHANNLNLSPQSPLLPNRNQHEADHQMLGANTNMAQYDIEDRHEEEDLHQNTESN